jgi:hypothetical protein
MNATVTMKDEVRTNSFVRHILEDKIDGFLIFINS